MMSRLISVAAAVVSTIGWFHSRFPAVLQGCHRQRGPSAAGLALWGSSGCTVWPVCPRTSWRGRPRAEWRRRPRVADTHDHYVCGLAAAAGEIAIRVDEEAVIPVAAGEER